MDWNWDSFWAAISEWCANTGVKILIALIILIISFTVINLFTKRMRKRAEKKNKENKTVVKTFAYILRITLKILVVIALIGYLGLDTSGISALIAALGVGVGLAVNGTLSNFAGGIMIIMTKPFRDDDYISACGYEGTVEDIKIIHTKIRTFDNKVIYLPNGTLSTSTIVNFTEKDLRRVDHKFSISYENDFGKAKEIIKKVAEENELVLRDPEVTVGIAAHGQNSIEIFARAWCKTENYWPVYNYMLEAVKKAFDENGIQIPYNQVDVHIKQ